MFNCHNGEVMFDMVSKFLTMLRLDWMTRLIGLVSDGVCNMTGYLDWIWCGAHQLDLVMEHIMNNVVKERFFTIMTGFITHITRQ
jgi:hypothetical protein